MMNPFGDRKTKEYLRKLKPHYNLKADKGSYELHFDFKIPSNAITKIAAKAFKIFKVDQDNLDLMNEEAWEISDLYHKQVLKKIRVWVDEVESSMRKKHKNDFCFVSRYLGYGRFVRSGNSFDVNILVKGSYVD